MSNEHCAKKCDTTCDVKRCEVTCEKKKKCCDKVIPVVGPIGPTGDLGTATNTGATGFFGATGTQGVAGTATNTGATGGLGATGIIGATGLTGATGATGSVGIAGPTGPINVVGVLGYGFITSTTGQAVLNDSPIAYNNTIATSSSITHPNPDSAHLTVADAGLYQINFTVTAVQAGQYSIFINNLAVATNTMFGTSASGSEITGFSILTLGAGDNVSVRNESGASVTLPLTAGGPNTIVNASILIKRLA